MAGSPTNPLPLREFSKVDLQPYIDHARATIGPYIKAAKMHAIASEILAAQRRAEAKHGDQNHLPDGTGPNEFFPQLGRTAQRAEAWAMLCKDVTDRRAERGAVTWWDILIEEIAEAGEQDDLQAIRSELLDAGAVIASWIYAIDTRIEE